MLNNVLCGRTIDQALVYLTRVSCVITSRHYVTLSHPVLQNEIPPTPTKRRRRTSPLVPQGEVASDLPDPSPTTITASLTNTAPIRRIRRKVVETTSNTIPSPLGSPKISPSPSPISSAANTSLSSTSVPEQPVTPENRQDVDDSLAGSKYTRLSQREHVLLRPEPYVGSMTRRPDVTWALDTPIRPENGQNVPVPRIVESEIEFAPALYKIFDEILVNAADNVHRNVDAQHPMSYIKVTINSKDCKITVENDGAAVPVVEHPEEKMYVPELIFGHLLTSSNFDDSTQRFVGGRHGFGAKMTNILSKYFEVTVHDGGRGRTFHQIYENNMATVHKPQIISTATKGGGKGKRNESSFTRISFKPDLPRFGYMSSELDTSTLCLMQRRVLDVSAALGQLGVTVYLNDIPLSVRSFPQYLSLVPAFGGTIKGGLTSLDHRHCNKALTQGGNHQNDNNNDDVDDDDDDDSDEPNLSDDTDIATSVKSELIYRRLSSTWEVAVGPKREEDGPSSNSGGGSGSKQTQISFVNGIATTRGGTHVTLIADQVARHIAQLLNEPRRKKRLEIGDVEVTPAMVRPHLVIFVNCLIPNPVFDSQTKDTLVTPLKTPNLIATMGPSKVHHTTSAVEVAPLPTVFLNAIAKRSGVLELVASTLRVRAAREVSKKLASLTKRTGRKQHLAIEKLEDAHLAGTHRSHECTLIVTEGDSAKALAVAGLEALGSDARDRYGVLPLRGKMLNVRVASAQQIADNKEIGEIAEALGLRHGEQYDTEASRRSLRYGSVMLMTDQDHDGSHIKGLFLNMLHVFWPSLLRCNMFVREFITPIVKAFPVDRKDKMKSGGQKALHTFYTLQEYISWKQSLSPSELQKFRIKYYKGLGTSTASEGREYFANLQRHVVRFLHGQTDMGNKSFVFTKANHATNLNSTDDAAMELAFSKDQIEARKRWLLQFNPKVIATPVNGALTVHTFIHHELVHFSYADTVRSIPCLMDGLKPGQRKILFGCFKRGLTNEIRVSQLAGYVSEHTGYHHGEESLNGTIVGMAQNFVGSNNLPLLEGVGQFGTRHMGGKDAASPRYIFTRLHPLTRKLFIPDDDLVLRYRDDDGLPVEPYYYTPVLPMVLINGAEGIGTGFSTFLPTFHPLDVVTNVRLCLRGQTMKQMVPWSWGFRGAIQYDEDRGRYFTYGIITKTSNNSVHISELPWGTWTASYKQFLTALLDDDEAPKATKSSTSRRGKTPSKTQKVQERRAAQTKENRHFVIKHFTEHHSENGVSFRITLDPSELQVAEEVGLYESFKLVSTLSVANIHLFDEHGKILRFSDVRDIISKYVPARLAVIEKRKEFLLGRLNMSMERAENRMRFIREVIAAHPGSASKPPVSTVFVRGKSYEIIPLVLHGVKKTNLVDTLRDRGYSPMSASKGKKSTEKTESTISSSHQKSREDVSVVSDSVSYEEAMSMYSSGNQGNDSFIDSSTLNLITQTDTSTTGKSSSSSHITDFDYLLSMPFTSMTLDAVSNLEKDIQQLKDQTAKLTTTTAAELWEAELAEIEAYLTAKNIPRNHNELLG